MRRASARMGIRIAAATAITTTPGTIPTTQPADPTTPLWGTYLTSQVVSTATFSLVGHTRCSDGGADGAHRGARGADRARRGRRGKAPVAGTGRARRAVRARGRAARRGAGPARRRGPPERRQ